MSKKETILSIILGIILPLGMLITTTLASIVSLSAGCTFRIDILSILHNELFFIVTVIMTLTRFSDFEPILERKIRFGVNRVGRLLFWVPIPMMALMLLVSLDSDQSCNRESGQFAIIWYYIVASCFLLCTLIIGAITAARFMSNRSRFHARRIVDRLRNLKKARLLWPALRKCRATREGWRILSKEYWPLFMNLQDSQKESLLPVLLLYAIDELTWELRELPSRLRSDECLICEQQFSINQKVVTCLQDPYLAHHYCLMRAIPNAKWAATRYLGANFRQKIARTMSIAKKWIDEGLSETKIEQRLRLGVFGETFDDVSAQIWPKNEIQALMYGTNIVIQDNPPN